MAIFKCKMCGGDLAVVEGATIAECEFCGTKQTIPSSKDENLQGLFNRANTLRIKSEFDKAEQLYEKIIQTNEKEAEAYWGLILCKYGIEYVEDPTTFKRVPTCHRTSFDSIIADDNYKAAIEYADNVQKGIYEAEAKEIDRIQKDILAISQNEEPYDVFICYKETDNAGQRTQDSVIANDIYYQLTQEGFKVFYAAITLEDKLGSAYEPCIFAALNSAKVMLAIGTKPEYFNAVWVKNEWSRYLKMMKNDRSKLLIPCYRDMDAYELPEEFAHLQAQDMGKIGFINDIVRGIKKVIVKDEPKATVVKETIVATESAGSNVAPLLKRVFMFLEDGNWQDADSYCEKVLDLDPENAQAYLGKLMAELQVKKQADLKNCGQPFDKMNNYQKACNFDKTLAEQLNADIKFIKERNENIRRTGIYENAKSLMWNAKSEADYKTAARTFQTIRGFKDADAWAKECLEKAENARKDWIYNDACKVLNSKEFCAGQKVDTMVFEESIAKFKSIPGWRDSDKKIDECQKKIAEIKEKFEADRIEAERKAEEERIAKQKAAKKRKKFFAIVTPIVCACIAFIIILVNVIIPNIKYSKAIKLYESEQYEDAITAFAALVGYKDSSEMKEKCISLQKEQNYNAALDLYNSENYEEAAGAFAELDGYRNSALLSEDCLKAIDYIEAVSLYNSEKYEEAMAAFTAVENYKDSESQIYKCESMLLKNACVEDIIYYGAYEQDDVISNGKEAIEWLVLAKEENKLLVISKKALLAKSMEDEWSSQYDYKWENCTLRKWLNESFIKDAFSDVELMQIQSSTISNYENDTVDKIFLLAEYEVYNYLSANGRECEPTAYAIAQGAQQGYNSANCEWWLRTPGEDENEVSTVLSTGNVSHYTRAYWSSDVCVRPAMWISIED